MLTKVSLHWPRDNGDSMSAARILPVTRVGSKGDTDLVVVEEPLEILINGSNLAITMRTPGNDEELAARKMILAALFFIS